MQIREGFINDDDEEEDEGDEDEDVQDRVVKRKREHRDRGEEERLDEDDLELIGEQIERRAPAEVCGLTAIYTCWMKRQSRPG